MSMVVRRLLIALPFLAVACADVTMPNAVEWPPRPILAAGLAHTCLLPEDGQPICWGRWGSSPEEPAAATLPVPVPLNDDTRFATISAGSHTCGLTTQGRAYCWGTNLYGAVGDGTTQPRAAPHPVATDLRFTAISAGTYSTCSLTAEGKAYCWGRNELGALGTGAVGPGARELSPVPVAGDVRLRALSGGLAHCGIDVAGRVHCWGSVAGSFDPLPWREPGDCTDRYYQWYQGSQCTTPTPLGTTAAFATVAVGGPTSCGVLESGAAVCWGEGWLGTLGHGAAGEGTHAVVPVTVSGGRVWHGVTAGGSHVCGLAASGEAYCWGNNYVGQLGNGESGGDWGIPIAAIPVPVVGGHRFVSLSAGAHHTCGITTEAGVWCWGAGTAGELGRDGALGNSHVPVRVDLP